MATKNLSSEQLFNAVADLLDEYPQLHKQDLWQTTDAEDSTSAQESECGTKACIAGWTCILGTDDFKLKGLKWVPKMSIVRELTGDPSLRKLNFQERVWKLEGYDYYRDTAVELLDLDHWDAKILFHENGHPRDGLTVAEALRDIANGASVTDVWTDGEDDEDDYDY